MVKLWVDGIEMKRALQLGFCNYLDLLGSGELKLIAISYACKTQSSFGPLESPCHYQMGATMVKMP